MRKVGITGPCLLLAASLVACAPWEQEGATNAPDGTRSLSLEHRNWGGGAGSTSHRLYYVVGDKKVLVMEGDRGYPVRAHWLSNSFAVIEYCGGNIEFFRSSTWADPNIDSNEYENLERVSFQLITQPGISLRGRPLCQR